MSSSLSTTAPDLQAARPRAAAKALGRGGWIGLIALLVVAGVCFLTLPITAIRRVEPGLAARGDAAPTSALYERQNRAALRLPPSWWPTSDERFIAGYAAAGQDAAKRAAADAAGVVYDPQNPGPPVPDEVARAAQPSYFLGTDHLGRSVLSRVLVGGAISLAIGFAAAALSVTIGVMYGAIAGYVGGRLEGAMMRIVDILYGLPYVLLVVLLAVAVDGLLDRWQASRVASIRAQSEEFVQTQIDTWIIVTREATSTVENREALAAAKKEGLAKVTASARTAAREKFGTGELTAETEQAINLVTLLVAIGGVSWLTMARVIRGQVLSLKAQPFMEAARAIGVPVTRQFTRHLIPNLVGPIIVYATLTVPQAILQESFLSFLGIGVKPPLPSWGNLAADGLSELNTVRSHWWMLVFPCILLAGTLLALNFLGEALREKLDPKRLGK